MNEYLAIFEFALSGAYIAKTALVIKLLADKDRAHKRTFRFRNEIELTICSIIALSYFCIALNSYLSHPF